MRAKVYAVRILSVLCICFGIAAVMLWRYTPNTVASQADTAVYPITEIPVGEIAAIAITNQKASFGVMLQNGVIEVVSDIQGNYDQSQLRALCYAVGHLNGSRKNTDQKSWQGFGIESPLARVTIFKTDGQSENFAVLSQNPIDQNYYLFSETHQAVYLISKREAELFLRQEEDFFNRSIFPVITTANYLDLQSLTLEYGGNGQDYTIEQQGGVFRITHPINQRVPASAVYQQLLRVISALYSDEFIAENADLAEYGFDNYTLKITMLFGSQQYTALLLDQGDDVCLMANPANGSVYRVTQANLAQLRSDYLTLLGGKAYDYSIGDLRNIVIEAGEKQMLFEISGQGEGVTATSGDLTLRGAEAAQLMQTLNSAKILRQVGPDDIVRGLPVLTLTFTHQNGSTEKVEFISADQSNFFVTINGVTNFVTGSAAVIQINGLFE